MTLVATEDARELCLTALNRRFDWLKRLLASFNGNVESLAPHHRQLWYLRQSIIGSYNHIGSRVDVTKREKAYNKLRLEIERRGRDDR